MIAGFYLTARNRLQPLYLTVRIVTFTCVLVQLLFMLRFIWNNLSDLNGVSENLCISVTYIVYVCKIFNFMLHWKKMIKLEEEIRKKISVQLTNKEEKALMDSVRFGRRFALAFRISCYVSAFFFSLSPFLGKKPNESLNLPVPIYLPFDPLDYYYQVCFVLSLSFLHGAWAHSSIDFIAITLLLFGTGQMEILKAKFDNVVRRGQKDNEDIIQRKLYECAEELNDIYR